MQVNQYYDYWKNNLIHTVVMGFFVEFNFVNWQMLYD